MTELDELKSTYAAEQKRAEYAWFVQSTTTYAEGYTLCETEAAALAAFAAERAKDKAWDELQAWYVRNQPEPVEQEEYTAEEYAESIEPMGGW